MKKSFMKLTVIVIAAIFFPKAAGAKAADVVIDGQFDDWGSISSYDIADQSAYFDQASLAYDEYYIYLHVKEAKSKAWETNYPTLKINCDGTSKNIVIVRKSYSEKNGIYDLQVSNDWWTAVNNATGKVERKNGYNEWEIKLPIYDIYVDNLDEQTTDNLKECRVDSLNVSWDTGGNVSLAAPYIGAPITPTPPPEEPGSAFISIDGYYDDWESMPKTDIYYNKNHTNSGSLVKDDNYIYLFVEMNPKNKSQIPLTGINLTVNNQNSCQLFISYPNSDGTTDWSKDVNRLSAGIYTGLAPFTYYPNNALGDVAVEISTGSTGDRLELRVDIGKLEQNMGLDEGTINSGADIKVNLYNVGNQELEVVGVSTGANLCILVSLAAVALINVYKFRRKKLKA
jgi:hypothetical protein